MTMEYNHLNPFPHIKNLQQTSLNMSKQKYRKKILPIKEQLLKKVENIVARGEITHYD